MLRRQRCHGPVGLRFQFQEASSPADSLKLNRDLPLSVTEGQPLASNVSRVGRNEPEAIHPRWSGVLSPSLSLIPRGLRRCLQEGKLSISSNSSANLHQPLHLRCLSSISAPKITSELSRGDRFRSRRTTLKLFAPSNHDDAPLS